MRLAILTLLLAAQALAQSAAFDAVLHKPLWRDQAGRLELTPEAVEFQPKGDKPPLRWEYGEIQTLDRVSRTELRLLTYEDVTWRLGQDRELRFTLQTGEIGDELFRAVAAHVARPAVDRVIAEADEPRLRLSAKHLHGLGGCQGELLFYQDRVVFDSEDDAHDRDWRLGQGLESVWSADPFELEAHTRESRAGHRGELRTWRFQLGTRLDPELYRALKQKLYALVDRP
ncbi:MAG: hypothetical protein GC160_09960 [Acidobacteria bacterium]|nr:hypothetical protein [Acidobacteriota bacterium]